MVQFVRGGARNDSAEKRNAEVVDWQGGYYPALGAGTICFAAGLALPESRTLPDRGGASGKKAPYEEKPLTGSCPLCRQVFRVWGH